MRYQQTVRLKNGEVCLLRSGCAADGQAAYDSFGFVEYGRNPKGFRSRHTGWQELILMRLELI